MAKKLEIPTGSKLIVPEEDILWYSPKEGTPLTKDTLERYNDRFACLKKNFRTFYGTVTEGIFLARVVGLTSQTSFMNQVLQRVREEASFKNSLTELLHGENTEYKSISIQLPWISIIMDYFTTTPIPDNLEEINIGKASLKQLKDIITKDKEFYNSVIRGIKIPQLESEASLSAKGIDGLEFRVFGGNKPIKPKWVNAECSTLTVDDNVYYNGLPADRAKYPSLLLAEGTKISLTVKNKSNNKLYLVIPTINGIPFNIDKLGLYCDGFEQTSYPVSHIEPLLTYIKPGEEKSFDKFFVNESGIVKSKDGSYICSKSLNDYRRIELSSLISDIFNTNMGDDAKELLNDNIDPNFREFVMLISQVGAMNDFIKYLNEPKQADIYISSPVVADSKLSSQLDNPFLGSIGLAIIEVSPPPIKPRHDRYYARVNIEEPEQEITRLGLKVTRSLGMSGLAEIGAGADEAATKADFWESIKYDTMIHKFVGYIPLNLMSLK